MQGPLRSASYAARTTRSKKEKECHEGRTRQGRANEEQRSKRLWLNSGRTKEPEDMKKTGGEEEDVEQEILKVERERERKRRVLRSVKFRMLRQPPCKCKVPQVSLLLLFTLLSQIALPFCCFVRKTAMPPFRSRDILAPPPFLSRILSSGASPIHATRPLPSPLLQLLLLGRYMYA